MKRLFVFASLAISGAALAQAIPLTVFPSDMVRATFDQLSFQQIQEYAIRNEGKGGRGDPCASDDIATSYKFDAHGAMLQCDSNVGRWQPAKLTDQQELQEINLYIHRAEEGSCGGGLPVC